MCTGLETLLVGGALSLGSSLLSPSPKAPPQQLPARDPTPPKQPGATVKAGDGLLDNDVINPTAQVTQPETRSFGRPVGGLGKSGLSI